MLQMAGQHEFTKKAFDAVMARERMLQEKAGVFLPEGGGR